MKTYALEVVLEHVISFDEQLGSLLRNAPGDLLPLVKLLH